LQHASINREKLHARLSQGVVIDEQNNISSRFRSGLIRLIRVRAIATPEAAVPNISLNQAGCLLRA
jgi:hypothetical protein